MFVLLHIMNAVVDLVRLLGIEDRIQICKCSDNKFRGALNLIGDDLVDTVM